MAKPESNSFFKAHTSVNRISKIHTSNDDTIDFSWNMKAIYLYILQFQGNVDSVFLSQETISQELGIERKTVNRLLKKMELAGIYLCGRGQGKSWKGFKSNISQVITLTELIAKDGSTQPKLTKTTLPNTQPVENEENAGTITSSSGPQNSLLESTESLRDGNMDNSGDVIQLSDVTELTGANDDLCLTVVEPGCDSGGEMTLSEYVCDRYIEINGLRVKYYEQPEPDNNGWELDPPF